MELQNDVLLDHFGPDGIDIELPARLHDMFSLLKYWNHKWNIVGPGEELSWFHGKSNQWFYLWLWLIAAILASDISAANWFSSR